MRKRLRASALTLAGARTLDERYIIYTGSGPVMNVHGPKQTKEHIIMCKGDITVGAQEIAYLVQPQCRILKYVCSRVRRTLYTYAYSFILFRTTNIVHTIYLDHRLLIYMRRDIDRDENMYNRIGRENTARSTLCTVCSTYNVNRMSQVNANCYDQSDFKVDLVLPCTQQ